MTTTRERSAARQARNGEFDALIPRNGGRHATICCLFDFDITQIDVATHPELHHYTTLNGLSRILQSNSIWATHFFALNDATEVTLLRDPLTHVVANRFLNYAKIGQGTDYLFSEFLREHGGPRKVAFGDADRLIEILYEKIFASTLANPFVASFCSHANDQSYEKENGLLSQWRGYANECCIVFGTADLVTLLTAEFYAHNWVHLTIAPVRYGIDDNCVASMFPVLIQQLESFFSRVADGKNPIPENESLTSLFIAGATHFKHQAFREEREVRIVGIPANKSTLDMRYLRGHPEYDPPGRWKKINVRDVKQIRYISLFDTLEAVLPIKRVIVGPSRNQNENYARARESFRNGFP
jgi:hypothetical protein